MSAATLSLLILAVAVVLFVWNRLPVEIVAVGCALTLLFAGLIDVQTAFSGFGDPVIVFIAAMFIVGEGLEASGVTAWISDTLSRVGGSTYRRLLVTVMGLAALVSAVITVTGSAAALLPVTVAVARSARLRPSRVLIPLAFAASAGSLLTMSGSPVNVIVHEASLGGDGGGFGYLEFGLIGVPAVAATILVCVLFGRLLVPDRTPTEAPVDFTDYVPTLVEHWGADYRVWRLTVAAGAPAVGAQAGDVLGESGVRLIAAQTASGRLANSDQPLGVGDSIVVDGDGRAVAALAAEQRLTLTQVVDVSDGDLINRTAGVAEVVIPPRSEWLECPVFPGMLGWNGLTVLAVRRRNADRGPRVTTLEPGDMLLMHGQWDAIDGLDSHDMLVVESADDVRRQTVPLGPTASRAIGILAVMVILLAIGVMPAAVVAVLAAGAMVLARVVRLERAYRAIPWQTVILIAALIPLSDAISSSGAADAIARPIVDAVGDANPVLILAILFLLTATLGQFISNVATVLIVVPIALSTAAETGLSVQPILMTVAVAGAAALLTPIATPANLIVMNPGGYRFGDYWRLGLAVMLTWLVLALLLIPLFWPLTG